MKQVRLIKSQQITSLTLLKQVSALILVSYQNETKLESIKHFYTQKENDNLS